MYSNTSIGTKKVILKYTELIEIRVIIRKFVSIGGKKRPAHFFPPHHIQVLMYLEKEHFKDKLYYEESNSEICRVAPNMSGYHKLMNFYLQRG